MKKYAILVILLLSLTIGGVGTAHVVVSQLADDVTITETVLSGDKEAVDGLTVTTKSLYNDTPLHWETKYTIGKDEESSCLFNYKKEKNSTEGVQSEPSLTIYSGPDETEESDDGYWEEVGYFPEKAIQDVIEKAEAGSTYKETVQLNQYMDFYTVSLIGNYTDETGYPLHINGDGSQYFQIPIIENSLWTIKVKKDKQNQPYSVKVTPKRSTRIYAKGTLDEEAAYVFVTDMTVYDKKQEKTETVALPKDTCGLHRIPYGRDVSQGIGQYCFDFSKAELVLPLPQGQRIYAPKLTEDKRELRYFQEEGNTFSYVIVDTTTFAIKQKIRLPYTVGEYVNTDAFSIIEKVDQGEKIIVFDNNQFCFLAKDESGLYKMVLSDTLFRKNAPGWYYPYDYIDWIYHKDKLILGALYGKEEEAFTASCSYQISAYQDEKLVYCGLYESSLDHAAKYEEDFSSTIKAAEKESIQLTIENTN